MQTRRYKMEPKKKDTVEINRIRIVIADEQTLFRAGIHVLLDTESDIEIVSETGTGREAIELCEKLQPNILLLELDLPDIDGFEVIRQLIASNSRVRILVLTMYDNEEYAIRLIKSGATGYINKGITPEELLKAIKDVSSGKTYLSPSLKDRITSRLLQPGAEDPVSLLSNRELQILIRLGRGETISDISEDLFLSPRTVETYKSRAMTKLGLKNLGSLVRFAIQNKLIRMF